jgi:hypothetical protein
MSEKRRTKRFDDATLAVIQAEHNANELTLDAIGKRHNCTGAYICKLARENGWPRRRAVVAAAGEAAASIEKPRPVKKRPRPDVRVMIKRRMCKVINRKLKEMEQGMQSGDMKPAELERHTKVVTSMIGGLQKVGGPEESEGKVAQADNGGGNDEVERLQREIVERFERIQKRREAERGSA